ncbi:hypothetical protein COLO4_28221 [Corchorus olitorius]|uniref:Uncharacterized protein n=1 Tax=Corchorus olitorius TaxID=93759 RepID=A0A1R3HMI6_9ROSI|nr:hypothetical protein COLO4_28221 [Corchorus olitorius]
MLLLVILVSDLASLSPKDVSFSSKNLKTEPMRETRRQEPRQDSILKTLETLLGSRKQRQVKLNRPKTRRKLKRGVEFEVKPCEDHCRME